LRRRDRRLRARDVATHLQRAGTARMRQSEAGIGGDGAIESGHRAGESVKTRSHAST
jgi:hypothetical protein